MKNYEEKLKRFIEERGIQCEHLVFDQSCHSVEEAARAVNAERGDFVKSICMIDSHGDVIVAIVKGEDRASRKLVGEALNTGAPHTAKPDEMLEKTGYPCGGTPPFGFEARFLIDPKVVEKGFVYAGGGSDRALIKISPSEMQRANKGKIVRIRK